MCVCVWVCLVTQFVGLRGRECEAVVCMLFNCALGLLRKEFFSVFFSLSFFSSFIVFFLFLSGFDVLSVPIVYNKALSLAPRCRLGFCVSILSRKGVVSYCICRLRRSWRLGSRSSVCKSSEVLFASQTVDVGSGRLVEHCAWFLRCE